MVTHSRQTGRIEMGPYSWTIRSFAQPSALLHKTGRKRLPCKQRVAKKVGRNVTGKQPLCCLRIKLLLSQTPKLARRKTTKMNLKPGPYSYQIYTCATKIVASHNAGHQCSINPQHVAVHSKNQIC